MLTRVLTTTAMTLALSAPAWAQQQSPTEPQPQQQEQMQEPSAQDQQQPAEAEEIPMTQLSMAQSDTIKGSAVRNAQGERVGEVEDIVFSMPDGQLSYAIVGVGGFLGVGEKSVAVPWQRLQASAEPESFVLDVDRQTLANAPAVDVEQFAASPDQQTIEQIAEFWQQSEPEQPEQPER